MNSTSFWFRLIRGVKEHPWLTLVTIFTSYSVLWTIIESVSALLPDLGVDGKVKFAVLIIIALFSGIFRMAVPSKISIKVPGSNTVVNVSVDDIFAFEGHKIVAVNEFFDSQLGNHVSPNSLHGQAITRLFGCDSNRFEAEVDQSLSEFPRVITERTSGRTAKYETGTTAIVPIGQYKLILTALCHTDIKTLKAYASVEDLWITLMSVWRTVRIHSNGYPVAIPLIGAGLAGVKLPYQGILELIILSIISESRDGDICKDITIILSQDTFKEINLKSLTTR